MAVAYVPGDGVTWLFVYSTHRCSQCGELVEKAWLAYTSPSTWTLVVCETCADALTKEGD